MSTEHVSLVWFRLDLRLTDNPALQAAVSQGRPVIPVFVWSPEEEGRWGPGAASRWWLHTSLRRLDASLRARGSRLIIRRGQTSQTIRTLLEESGASAVYWNRRYEPAVAERDRHLETMLRAEGRIVRNFNGALLYEPWNVGSRSGRPFRVFSAFWRACQAQADPEAPQAAPETIEGPRRWPAAIPLKELRLSPAVDWAVGLRAQWRPGEAGALQSLDRFRDEGISGYATRRDHPDRLGTSRLSPHLHFGEISPRQVWSAVRGWPHRSSDAQTCFLRELGWREFAYHLLFHFRQTPERPLRTEFEAFPWEADAEDLRAWQRGQTGYPIVDAGMRELWRTGWMHNRVRMIAASFLVKDLLIPWQEGAAWFWDTLVDADLANNTAGWQWVVGCGADAAPYFRIYNPVTQGETFDPSGDYVRRWVPELRRLPNEWLHRPWEAPAGVLSEAGVELGIHYPRPIVDHREARARALAAFGLIKGSGARIR
jgi:deoxyribodipyrimidine photo-lyase